MSNTIRVAIAVTINDETKTFAAEATTPSDAYRVADGVLDGLKNDAYQWLVKAGGEARRGY